MVSIKESISFNVVGSENISPDKVMQAIDEYRRYRNDEPDTVTMSPIVRANLLSHEEVRPYMTSIKSICGLNIKVDYELGLNEWLVGKTISITKESDTWGRE